MVEAIPSPDNGEKLTTEQEKEKASRGLMQALVDVVDSLPDPEPNSENNYATEQEAYEKVREYLCQLDLKDPDNLMFITAVPRQQSKMDYRLLPGQHAGVHVLLADKPRGNILTANFYGGLRGVGTADSRDMSRQLDKLHASRTDQIVDQLIQLNLQITTPDPQKKFLDMWFNYAHSRDLWVRKMLVEGQPVHYYPHLNAQNRDQQYVANSIFPRLNQNMESLVRLIENTAV